MAKKAVPDPKGTESPVDPDQHEPPEEIEPSTPEAPTTFELQFPNASEDE